MRTVRVVIATPLQSELVSKIAGVDSALEVVYRPDLIGQPRSPADHTPPVFRTEEQNREWARLLAEAEVLFDIDLPSASNLAVRAPRLRWIQSTSSGVGEWIQRLGIADSEILVTNAAGVHATPLAEYVVFAALYFAKRMPKLLHDSRDHRWEVHSVQTLRGKTIGIVSLGRVGREVARYCRLLGMRVIGTKRDIRPGDAGRLGVDQVFPFESWADWLPDCDYLVLIVPLTSETKGLIGRPQLDALKSSAVLINIARGATVDEVALLETLQSGRIAGAALDVFEVEPLPATSPFWDLENVLITPHNISASDDENQATVEIFCDNLRRYLSDEPLRNLVDKNLGYAPPE